MANYDARIDDYIEKAEDFAQPILRRLRELVHAACPDVEETWKWSFPNFMYRGSILCNMAAFKKHCSFGFWKASLMQDAENVLSITEREGMGNLGKITSLKDLPKNAVMKKYIKAAMRLNDDGIKAQRKPKPTDEQKKELQVPAYFTAELKKSPAAKEKFEAMSYSHKKEYVQWFEEAKTDATRDKRVAQAIEWITEGKGRNWKYM